MGGSADLVGWGDLSQSQVLFPINSNPFVRSSIPLAPLQLLPAREYNGRLKVYGRTILPSHKGLIDWQTGHPSLYIQARKICKTLCIKMLAI